MDSESIIYCINGGGMIKDMKISKHNLNFNGSYFFPDVFELRELTREELLSNYKLPEYSLCENEIKERNEKNRLRKKEINKSKKTYQSYKYYAKTKFNDVICHAFSMGALAKKMNVSIDVIKYRRKHKPKNSRYVDVEVIDKEKDFSNEGKYQIFDKDGILIFESSSYEKISSKLNISVSTVYYRIKKGREGKVFDDFNIYERIEKCE